MPDRTSSRRDAIKAASLTLAAVGLTCSGLGYVALRRPEVERLEPVFEKDQYMNNRVLVTYATRAGSTSEIAAAIGQSLTRKGVGVDVKPVKEEPSLDGYKGVIMGSAIRMGNWLPEAVAFVKTNQSALGALPVALFTAHLMNTGDDEASRANRHAYLDKFRPLLNNPEEVYFEGKMDFSSLSFLDRWVAKMVKSVETDNRDWGKIRKWTPALIASIYLCE